MRRTLGWQTRDQEILEAACASNSVLLTEDHHFHDLKRFGPGSHPGIVILKTKDLPAYEKTKAARELLEKLHDVDIRGAVVIGGTGGWYNVLPPE